MAICGIWLVFECRNFGFRPQNSQIAYVRAKKVVNGVGVVDRDTHGDALCGVAPERLIRLAPLPGGATGTRERTPLLRFGLGCVLGRQIPPLRFGLVCVPGSSRSLACASGWVARWVVHPAPALWAGMRAGSSRSLARASGRVVRRSKQIPRLRFLMLRYFGCVRGNWDWGKWRDPSQRPDH